MNAKEIVKLLISSNISLVSRQTKIPKDRMHKWKQGKGTPKIEDLKILEDYFNGTILEQFPNNENQEIEDLRNRLREKDKLIDLLEKRVEHLEQVLNQYEPKSKDQPA